MFNFWNKYKESLIKKFRHLICLKDSMDGAIDVKLVIIPQFLENLGWRPSRPRNLLALWKNKAALILSSEGIMDKEWKALDGKVTGQ